MTENIETRLYFISKQITTYTRALNKAHIDLFPVLYTRILCKFQICTCDRSLFGRGSRTRMKTKTYNTPDENECVARCLNHFQTIHTDPLRRNQWRRAFVCRNIIRNSIVLAARIFFKIFSHHSQKCKKTRDAYCCTLYT